MRFKKWVSSFNFRPDVFLLHQILFLVKSVCGESFRATPPLKCLVCPVEAAAVSEVCYDAFCWHRVNKQINDQ